MVFNALLIKESILPTSFDNVLLDADLVDNAGLVDFSSSGACRLGMPLFSTSETILVLVEFLVILNILGVGIILVLLHFLLSSTLSKRCAFRVIDHRRLL